MRSSNCRKSRPTVAKNIVTYFAMENIININFGVKVLTAVQ